MSPEHMTDGELARALHNGDLTELDLGTARRLAEALDPDPTVPLDPPPTEEAVSND